MVMKQNLGPYKLIGVLGRGGMGLVYQGYETSLKRFVAIKVLADSLAHDIGVKERFLREARSMAALNDPHIIQIYFIGEEDGQTYFVMEFVDGESLGSLLKREGKLKPEQAAKIIYQTAQGLETAHDKGVIHRDIKPGNLMLTRRGGVKIADFGIALKTQDFSKKLTSTGEFVGTPGYISPEVCLSRPVDQRSDIFSLGIVLFECLAGRMPFTDESPLGLMLEVVNAQIPDVSTLNEEVDPELSRVLSKMIAKDPAHRYQSCQALIEDLGRHPLVAKGGALGLITQSARLEPLRHSRALAASGIAGVTLATAGGDTKTASSTDATFVHASDIAASTPMLRQDGPSRSGARRHYWTAAGAAALVAAASAWAFRNHLPPIVPLLSDTTQPVGSSTTAPVAVFTTTPAAANTATPRIAGVAGKRTSKPDDSTDPALLNALWLEDVPDDMLADAASESPSPTSYAPYPGPYSAPTTQPYTAPYPHYPAVAYAYPTVLPALAPPAYFVTAPWRIGFGFSIGIGYWATRVVTPATAYAGPVLQPALVGTRPLLGTSAAAGTVVVTSGSAGAPRPLAGTTPGIAAARPLARSSSPVTATGATGAARPLGGGTPATNPAVSLVPHLSSVVPESANERTAALGSHPGSGKQANTARTSALKYASATTPANAQLVNSSAWQQRQAAQAAQRNTANQARVQAKQQRFAQVAQAHQTPRAQAGKVAAARREKAEERLHSQPKPHHP